VTAARSRATLHSQAAHLCKRCTLDPINLVARRRHVADPTASRPFDATIEDILDNDRAARRLAAEVIAAARR
jgi:hypothetical protein